MCLTPSAPGKANHIQKAFDYFNLYTFLLHYTWTNVWEGAAVFDPYLILLGELILSSRRFDDQPI